MKKVNVIQGSPEWLLYRKSKITSTDMAAIMNLSPWVTAVDLWREKVGLKPPPVMTAPMQRGRDHEDDARLMAIDELGLHFTPEVVVSDDAPWLMASLDGMSDNGQCLIEIKTPQPHNFEKTEVEPIPKHYYIQMQAAMAACDGIAKMCHYCVYSPELGRLNIRPVERDEAMISDIIEQSRIFWRRIREFDCPPPLHRVIETQQMAEAVDRYRIAKDMAARAKEMLEEAQAEIESLAGEDSVQGFGLKLTRYWRKGNVDYSQIPALKEIDLEKYRKPGAEQIRISINN